MSTIGFGAREDADADHAGRCARMHARVQRQAQASRSGDFPAGTPYRADQPDLLLWVLFTLVDSGIVVYRKYVGSMSRAEEAAYWDDYKVVGELFGLDALGHARHPRRPATTTAARCSRATPCSSPTGPASARARSCSSRRCPGSPSRCCRRPTSSPSRLLPDRIRREYGFAPLPPAPVRKALVAGGAEYVKRAVIPFVPDRLRLRAGGAGRLAA